MENELMRFGVSRSSYYDICKRVGRAELDTERAELLLSQQKRCRQTWISQDVAMVGETGHSQEFEDGTMDHEEVKVTPHKADKPIGPDGGAVAGADKEERILGADGSTDSMGRMGERNQAVLLSMRINS